MATQPDDDNELNLDNELDLDPGEDREDDERDTGTDDDAADEPGKSDEGAEEEILTFGDDLAEDKPDDSALIKHLREQIRERDRKLREASAAPAQPEMIDPGPEPTLADCDYDEDKLKAKWREWNERMEAESRRKADATRAQREATEAWEAEKKRYTDGKTTLPYADADEAEETVIGTLGENLFGALIMATDQPAKVMYALARHPDKLAQLAAHKNNPVKFVAQVAKLEKDLKMVKRRKQADPDTPEQGSGSIQTGRKDKELERLEKEAERTNDRTKLVAYKKRLKEKAKA